MHNASVSLKQLNRTFIGSVLFIDIVGYSTRTVPDQIQMKELFINLLAEAVQNVVPDERIMVDTGDGAGIAFLGDPEDALFAALSLRDAIDTGKATVGEPGFVRMGINLGPLKIVRDINGHTNMIGDGVNDAQRVMSFAEPGQVMVSHSYYDIISRFSRDYQQLFVYEGTRHDKHVREHEVYRFGPSSEDQPLAEKLRDRSRARQGDATIPPHAPLTPPPPARNKALPRIGLIATAVGAATVVGAVWSWGSKPEQQANLPATVKDVPTAIAPAASSPNVAGNTEPKAAEIKVAAKNPEPPSVAAKPSSMRDETSSEASGAVEKTSDKDTKAAENAAAAVKPGTVKLAVQPWGEIFVDGSKRGISPPLKSLSLAPGKHRIEIRNGEFTPYKETVEVKSGSEATVQYVF